MKTSRKVLSAVFATVLLIAVAASFSPNKAVAKTDNAKEYQAWVTVLEKSDVIAWSENENGEQVREVVFMGYNGTIFRVFFRQDDFDFPLDAFGRWDPSRRPQHTNKNGGDLEVGKNYLVHYRSGYARPGAPKQIHEITYSLELRQPPGKGGW